MLPNQGLFSNMASDWLAAELPANQMSDMKIFFFSTNMDFNMEIP